MIWIGMRYIVIGIIIEINLIKIWEKIETGTKPKKRK